MATTAPNYHQDRRATIDDRRNNVTSIGRMPITTTMSDGMRVSWAGVWGGVLAAVGVLLLLAALGVAVGVSAADPATTDAATAGSAAGIWAAVSLLIALFVGGMVSTRASAIHDGATSFWEGFLVWVTTLLLVAYLATSGITSLASGAMQAMGTASQAVAASGQGPKVAQGAGADKADPGSAVDQLKAKAASATSGLQEKAAQAQPAATKAAWATFGALLLSLLASVFGAAVGRRKYQPAVIR